MIIKHCNSSIPRGNNIRDTEKKFLSKLFNLLPTLSLHIDNQEINLYLKKIWDIVAETNKYFNDSKPWELKNNNKESFENILYITAERIKQIAIMIYPAMPQTSVKILSLFSREE